MLLGAAALMFAPIVFVHPLRVDTAARGDHRARPSLGSPFAGAGDRRRSCARRWWVEAGLIATAAYFLACRCSGIRPGRDARTGEKCALPRRAKLAIGAPRCGETLRSPPASWRSGYAEDCKSLHPGSIPGEASTRSDVAALAALRGSQSKAGRGE